MLDSLAPQICTSCLDYLYHICDHQALLPRSLEIPLHYDPTKYPLCSGVSADVWKGQCNGREVAAKVLRLYPNFDLGLVKRVGPRWCSQPYMSINSQLRHVEILQGGYDMENPPPPECTVAVRRDDDRESVRDGIGVDGKW